MFITSVNNINSKNYNIQKKQFVLFRGAKLPGGICYEDFIKQAKEQFQTDSFEKLSEKIVENADKLIGQGSAKKVFTIRGINDYVLAIFKREYKIDEPIKPFMPIEPELPDYNFSQSIAKNNQGFYIMGKVDGESHADPRWFTKIIKSARGLNAINNSDAKSFLSQLKNIEKYPLNAYEHLGEEFSYLNENGIRVDSMNPNNIIVDKKKQIFNYIDIFHEQKRFQSLKAPLNGVSDMIAMLLDSLLHTNYLSSLAQNDVEDMKSVSEDIIGKCKLAADNVKLSNTIDNTRKHVEIIQDITSKQFGIKLWLLERFDSFKELYKDKL